jgi:hypothetical protein
MTTAMYLTSILMAAAMTLFAPAAPPRCIDDLIRSESGARAHVSAPTVDPARGEVGSSMRIRGAGFTAGARLTIAAVFAERGCVIQGLGDQYLGSTVADGRGAYAVSIRWPATFDPVLGRNKTEKTALPRGRYYVFALPCEARAACSFTAGTQPGGPFVLGDARASPAPVIAGMGAAAVVLILGILVVRRRAR